MKRAAIVSPIRHAVLGKYLGALSDAMTAGDLGLPVVLEGAGGSGPRSIRAKIDDVIFCPGLCVWRGALHRALVGAGGRGCRSRCRAIRSRTARCGSGLQA